MLLLVLAVVIFMGISLVIGLQQSVWFDEAYSVMLAQQNMQGLLHLTAMDTHPPLYYMLLKAWAALFGWGELALRSLSVLAAGGALALAALLVRRTFGVRAALVTLPFLAFVPMLLRYGFEIRMYAIASLIGVAATYALVAALAAAGRKRVLWFAAYAVLVAMGVYALYYMALLWLAHVAWLVWLARKNKQPVFASSWMAALVGSVALFLPWLPTFLGQLGNNALTPVAGALTLDNMVGIITFNFVYQPAWRVSPLLALLVLAVTLLLGYFSVQAFKTVKKAQRPYLVLLALYVLVPLLLLAVISLLRPMYVERYLSHFIIGGVMFMGVAVALVTKHGSPVVRSFAMLLFVTMLVGVSHLASAGNYNYQRVQQPEAKQIAEVLNCQNKPVVVAGSLFEATELGYYAKGCDIRYVAEDRDLRGGYLPAAERFKRVITPKELAGKDFFYVHHEDTSMVLPAGSMLLYDREFDKVHVKRIIAR